MAAVEEAGIPRKGPSLVIQIGVLLVMTLAAIGTGWFAGNYLGNEKAPADASAQQESPEHVEPEAKAEAPAGEHGEPAADGHGGEAAAVQPLLVALAPMTTNLAAPSTVWVRVELALLLATPQPPDMVEAIHQDLFAYLKTLKMHQIEGASGYQHLKGDLEERARIRSDGQVKQVLIRTLLFE